MDKRLTAERVVDLLRYKQDHQQPRLNGLDGLDRQDLEARRVSRPTLTAVAPFRPLTAREVEHRQRMVNFLGASATKVVS